MTYVFCFVPFPEISLAISATIDFTVYAKFLFDSPILFKNSELRLNFHYFLNVL